MLVSGRWLTTGVRPGSSRIWRWPPATFSIAFIEIGLTIIEIVHDYDWRLLCHGRFFIGLLRFAISVIATGAGLVCEADSLPRACGLFGSLRFLLIAACPLTLKLARSPLIIPLAHWLVKSVPLLPRLGRHQQKNIPLHLPRVHFVHKNQSHSC